MLGWDSLMRVDFGTDAEAVTVTLFLGSFLLVCTLSCAGTTVSRAMVHKTLWNYLAEKEPFMHLLLPICCSSTSFQVVASENLCSSTVGGTGWGQEEEM